MAMDKSAADAYIYAKASGMLAKSFIGSRAIQLFNVHSLQELWSLLFTTEVPIMPETLLAKALENEAYGSFVADYKKLLSNYAQPADILIVPLQYYDYENIKDVGAALCFKEHTMPSIIDISPFNLIDYKKWPDIAAMTAKSPFSWYNTVPVLSEQQKNDYRLDTQYIQALWSAGQKVNGSCRAAIIDLLSEKVCMDNILWVLRLRLYYDMPRDEIIECLAYSTEARNPHGPLEGEAVKILDWELDNYEQWRRWKYATFLNPHEEGVVWTVDPRWIYNMYRKQYVEKAYRLFHQYPFTECPLFCWYIIKRHELDTIRTAAESLRLSIPSSQAMKTAGVLEETDV